MSVDKPFTKDNLDSYLRDLGKEFRIRNGKGVPGEIILIGGASVLINYGFREMTYDIDAIILAQGAMKDSIITVGDKYGLPHGWLNTDFMKTPSYTPRLVRYSKYYKTFSNVLQIRTISAEYLIAMKLMAGRQYKHDMSDIIGILLEQIAQGEAISFAKIKQAVVDLYDNYDNVPDNSRLFIESVFEKENLQEFYNECLATESENKELLIEFDQDYPSVLNENNLVDILRTARSKKTTP